MRTRACQRCALKEEIMSKYSGKCDFGDSWGIHGEEQILNSNIYLGRNIIPLRIDSYKDALPYFPYLVGMSAFDNVNGKGEIRLSERSFVDMEEEERLTWVLNDAKRKYRQCKRNKEEFDVEKVTKELSFFEHLTDIYRPIVEAVKKDGEKATVPDTVHISFHDYERKLLYNDMVEAGYDKGRAAIWVFGYQRFFYNDLPNGLEGGED